MEQAVSSQQVRRKDEGRESWSEGDLKKKRLTCGRDMGSKEAESDRDEGPEDEWVEIEREGFQKGVEVVWRW